MLGWSGWARPALGLVSFYYIISYDISSTRLSIELCMGVFSGTRYARVSVAF